MKVLIFIALLIAYVVADTYMQNPRGSNDRNNEANTDRDNANRLFDSQNNAKGGYCRGPPMSFYAGSQLSIQWTVQHGCGRNPALLCNVVLQYMCQSEDATDFYRIRDGSTTNTIEDDAATGPPAKDANGNYVFGMHEPYSYYQMCKGRDRNQGLFIADRQQQGGLGPGRRSAIFTRQNNNGNRHGYECTEERDYYPYWGPSPWVDIAILTQNTDWCTYYQTESQNVKARGYCWKDDPNDQSDNQATGNYARYLTATSCVNNGYTWIDVPAWGVDAPECVQAPFTRENHLGNSFNGFEAQYNWTLPSVVRVNASNPGSDCVATDTCECVLRLRYNISTSDAATDSVANFESAHDPRSGFPDYTLNGASSPIKQDPYVSLDGNYVKLAIDTSQFGRTFQDRTHMFHISPRPPGVLSTQRIFNLNVKGKRGNIVQAYPATEYHFVPEFLNVAQGDYIHFQWTGCDTNPAGNAGEGRAGTDRSNIMQMKAFADSKPITDDWVISNPDSLMFPDVSLRSYMTYLGQTGCLTTSQLTQGDQDPNNCYVLNAADQYFDGGLIRMNNTGTYYYMSSRNNNFSNRAQKAALTVDTVIPDWAVGTVVAGAAIFLGATTIGGLIMYAKTHPHSAASGLVSRL
jgi:hypothetical protein